MARLVVSAATTRASGPSVLRGSLGSTMKLVVEAFERRLAAAGALDDVAV
jgi:hypothetical protein